MMSMRQPFLVILGPTAGGKSALAISLARKYGGEIISADSRQVYRGMDVGTGKVARDKKASHPARDAGSFYSQGIRHHLLDVSSPKRSYNVSHFIRDAKKAFQNIQKRSKLPLVCGGTGFWVQAFLEGQMFPKVKPDQALRKKLEKKTTDELFRMLKKNDHRRARSIDRNNKIRLIRALEIIATLGKVPPPNQKIKNQNYFILALNPPKHVLQENMRKRLEKRLKIGMVKEVKNLRKEGIGWKRLESFGLEYKNIALFLQGKISRGQMKENIVCESWQYARRQLTWLRRWEKQGANIFWIRNASEGEKIAKQFLTS